jgi:protein-disulfide isomerase
MPPSDYSNSTSTSFVLPLAILCGFALLSLAVYLSGHGQNKPEAVDTNVPPTTPTASIPTVGPDDYIRGNPNAPIVIIEYSDYECPFCKIFHTTMQQLMGEYALTGKVAWVYRQFPAASLHPNAPKISEAALCVGKLGGQEAFWTFSDQVFNGREINEVTNMTRLPDFAAAAGVDSNAFAGCLESGEMAETVTTSVEAGLAAGITGTPHSILTVGNQQAIIEGAQPYEVIRQMVDSLIAQLDGRPPGGNSAPAETTLP